MVGSRRLWTWLAAFALAGVLLGALAAFVVRDRSSSSGDAPTSSPAVLATTAEPRSTAGATTEPAPVVTAVPTEAATAPAPTPVAATSLQAFGRHVGKAIKEGADLLEPLQTAAQAFDIPAVRSSAAALSAWAASESTWLDAHPPQACYAAVHETYASAIDDFGEAAAITERFARDFPFADYDSVQRALDLAQSGAASMQEAADLVKTVRC